MTLSQVHADNRTKVRKWYDDVGVVAKMKPNKRCFQRMVSEIMGNTHVLLNNAVTNLYKQKDCDNLQQSFM